MQKFFLVSFILVLCTGGWTAHGLGEQTSAPRGDLRIVDTSPHNWISMTFNVFEHLLESDAEGKLVPRLATGWRWFDDRTVEFTLRKGVVFHNGEVFDAEIVKLNWDEQSRLTQLHTAGSHMHFKPGSRLEIIDPYMVRFVFPEPDGGALVKLSVTHMANRQFYQEVGWGTEDW